jgi:hypothetical protein
MSSINITKKGLKIHFSTYIRHSFVVVMFTLYGQCTQRTSVQWYSDFGHVIGSAKMHLNHYGDIMTTNVMQYAPCGL